MVALAPLLLWAVSGVVAMDLATCKSDVTERLKNGTIAPDDAIFLNDSTGYMSHLEKAQLTIQGCKKTGSRSDFDMYEDLIQCSIGENDGLLHDTSVIQPCRGSTDREYRAKSNKAW
ncbi:hypothetical protein BKA56DRAFT_581021 [Ilyonectria sp. MPI-CAGE-AT-0026]|nr:hypothetical protein BKA56DRAFT_581021 [Ilyonectria sp. MPI-CAGE-AT-0026]